MNIKSIIASLVLAGSSSAAMASPVTFSGSVQAGVTINGGYTQPVIRDHRTYDNDWVRDHRTGTYASYATFAQPEPVDNCTNVSIDGGVSFYRGWMGAMPPSGHASITLTSPTKIMNGAEIFTLGPSKGGFQELTFNASSGATFIQSVKLVMGKGDVQIVPVDAWLSGRNPSFTFDVDGRRGRVIQSITVVGTSQPGARYFITSKR